MSSHPALGLRGPRSAAQVQKGRVYSLAKPQRALTGERLGRSDLGSIGRQPSHTLVASICAPLSKRWSAWALEIHFNQQYLQSKVRPPCRIGEDAQPGTTSLQPARPFADPPALGRENPLQESAGTTQSLGTKPSAQKQMRQPCIFLNCSPPVLASF